MPGNPYALDPFSNGPVYQDQYNNLPTTYDSNGYMNTFNVPGIGTNPWSSVVGQQGQALSGAMGAQAMIPGVQANISQQQAAMAAYGKSTEYPSFPNSAGLGSQQPFSNSPTTTPGGDPGASSRGFNPWSLTGEANSR